MPTLLFVAAHPDDDTFGVGRSVALHAGDDDIRFVLVHATDGEAGEIAPDVDISRDRLGAARREETRASWETIGRLPDRHEWLELPDGRLSEVPHQDLVAPLLAVMGEERPDVVVTFGPEGVTGHPDHIAISAATTDAFLTLAGEGRRGLQRLLYSSIPQSWIDAWNVERVAAGLSRWNAEEPFHLRGVPDGTIGVDVDTRSVVGTVVAAIRRHRTQWSYSTIGDDRALTEALRREHFVVAWPDRQDGTRVMSDIFEGLDAHLEAPPLV